MDARARRKSDERKLIPRFCFWAWSLFLLGLLPACLWWKPDALPSLSSSSFIVLKERVASIRRLSFNRDVSYDASLSAENGFDREYDASSVARLSRVYTSIGLLPDTADLGKAFDAFQRLQRLTYYDSRTERVVLAPESIRLGHALAGDDSRTAETIPLVFALTQALQEQHFPWSSNLRSVPAQDRRLALRAVTRGDVVLVGLAYLGGGRPERWPDQQQAIIRLANELDRMASDLPLMLREQLVFPYREGSQFVQWAYAARGMEGVNALFADPPLSTAQVMHPEKFYVRRQNPLRIVPWGLMREMKQGAILEQTLGEYLTQSLIAASDSRIVAARIASGWVGDHLSAYAEGKNVITCWISAWDNEAHAQSFLRAFETVLARRRRLRFEPFAGEHSKLTADLPGGGATFLQVKGSMVLFLDGLAAQRSLELAERVWQELETSAEPARLPFDLARGRPQFASSKR